MTRNNILKIIGSFVFIFGIFFLLLSITNIFNDVDFITQYDNCINVSKYTPSVLDSCKTNVSEGLGIAIRTNQVELSAGQYLKIYIRQIINVLLAVFLIILGDYLYVSSKHRNRQVKKESAVRSKTLALKAKPKAKKKVKPKAKAKRKK